MHVEIKNHIDRARGQGRRFVRFHAGLLVRAQHVAETAGRRGEIRPYSQGYVQAFNALSDSPNERVSLEEIRAGGQQLVVDLASGDVIARRRKLAVLENATTTTSS